MSELSKLSVHMQNILGMDDSKISGEVVHNIGIEWVDALPQGGVIVKTTKGTYKFVYEEVK